MRDDGQDFEAVVSAALLDPGFAPAVHGSALAQRLIADPGFAVYRNTVLTALVDALEANFPAVARLVGPEWFRAAAAVHARACPPAHPALVLYGASFPAFLQDFEPAAALPYLPAVAAMDRLWTAAHVAADAPVLTLDALAGLDPAGLGAMPLALHPAAQFAWFEHTAPSVWLDARGLTPEVDHIAFEARGEGLLITRPDGAVSAMRLDAGSHAFLQAAGEGAPLGLAAAAAAATQPGLELARLIGSLIGAGAFAASF